MVTHFIAVQNGWHSLRLELISLDFSINIHPSQYQVHRGAEIAKEYFLLIQSGDGDWIKNFFPSGLRLKPFDGYSTYQEPCPERTQGFLFGGISPPNIKIYSQRPRRLCGDNFILDKHEPTSNGVNLSYRPRSLSNPLSPHLGVPQR